MAGLVCLHDKSEIETYLRTAPFLHLYALGDLDDFFWPHTTWYALRKGGRICQLVLVYSDLSIPIVLANAVEPVGGMRDLLRALLPLLPKRFYGHVSEHVIEVFAEDYRIEPHGPHHKMGLTDKYRLARFDTGMAVQLSTADYSEIEAFYRASYPVNWFSPRMLETGHYFGIRQGPTLMSVAGVHVYSTQYKVVALGNIATRPEARGRGLATVVTAKLCRELLGAGIAHVGLNVKADNAAAIACYRKLGFEKIAVYGEYTLELK